MYFEKGFTAVNIAAVLDVNRNTINEDIKYWYSQITSQLRLGYLGEIFIRQIERMEIQRKRILDELEKQTDLEIRFKLEKMLFEIDQKITGFVSKMEPRRIPTYDTPAPKISEDEISEIIRFVVFEFDIDVLDTSHDELLKGIITLKKCTISDAEQYIEAMKGLGLGLYETEAYSDSFDLMSFGVSRRFVKQKEKDELLQKIKEYKQED